MRNLMFATVAAAQQQPDGVRRYGFPRSDLNVHLDGVAVKPALALGSWLAFMPVGDYVMLMGDLVVAHDEVNPVMSKLLAGKLTVTAPYNHMFDDEPRLFFMYFWASDAAETLARGLKAALDATNVARR